MKTMADLINEADAGSIARALKITGPLHCRGIVFEANSVGGVEVSWRDMRDHARPADQVPIPAAEPEPVEFRSFAAEFRRIVDAMPPAISTIFTLDLPPAPEIRRTMEITDGEFLTVGNAGTSPWKNCGDVLKISADEPEPVYSEPLIPAGWKFASQGGATWTFTPRESGTVMVGGPPPTLSTPATDDDVVAPIAADPIPIVGVATCLADLDNVLAKIGYVPPPSADPEPPPQSWRDRPPLF